MIFDVPYGCRMDVVLAKRHTVVTKHLRRIAHVEVPEHDRSHLAPLLTVTSPDDKHSFEILRNAEGAFFQSCHGIGEKLPPGTMTEMPALRRVSRDWQIEQEADLSALAASMVYIDGMLFRPIPEPYIELKLGYYRSEIVVRTDGINVDGAYPTFSIADRQVPLQMVAEHRAAQPAHGREYSESTPRIFVQDDRAHFAYSPTDNAILYTANKVLEVTRNVVGKMPSERIYAWVTLRDLLDRQRDKGVVDAQAVARQLASTYQALQPEANLKRYEHSYPIRRLMETVVLPSLESDLLEDFSLPPI